MLIVGCMVVFCFSNVTDAQNQPVDSSVEGSSHGDLVLTKRSEGGGVETKS